MKLVVCVAKVTLRGLVKAVQSSGGIKPKAPTGYVGLILGLHGLIWGLYGDNGNYCLGVWVKAFAPASSRKGSWDPEQHSKLYISDLLTQFGEKVKFPRP